MEKIYLLLLALAFSVLSCSKADNDRAISGWRVAISLEEALEDQGCLSIPKLLVAFKQIDPALPAIAVPTNIQFESQNGIRENFRRLIAYGQLNVGLQTMSEVQPAVTITQNACEQLTAIGQDGVAKNFAVKRSSRDSLMAEAEDGERIEFAWLSTQSVRSVRRYLAFDTPCSDGRKPILVSVTKVYDWSGNGVAKFVPESGSPFSIQPEFITLAAEAVGDPPSTYYAITEGGRQIDFSKVRELPQKTPRAEVISCSGAPPPPNDHPSDPDPDPNDPDGHPRDGGGGHP